MIALSANATRIVSITATAATSETLSATIPVYQYDGYVEQFGLDEDHKHKIGKCFVGFAVVR